jgi:hypothetical protein
VQISHGLRLLSYAAATLVMTGEEDAAGPYGRTEDECRQPPRAALSALLLRCVEEDAMEWEPSALELYGEEVVLVAFVDGGGASNTAGSSSVAAKSLLVGGCSQVRPRTGCDRWAAGASSCTAARCKMQIELCSS